MIVPRTSPTPPDDLAKFSGGESAVAHGTTPHGAQAVDPRYHCKPLVYDAAETPIGQVFTASQAARPGASRRRGRARHRFRGRRRPPG